MTSEGRLTMEESDLRAGEGKIGGADCAGVGYDFTPHGAGQSEAAPFRAPQDSDTR